MTEITECARCRNPIRWAGVKIGYRHVSPSDCPDSGVDPYPAQKPEELLASVRSAIEAAGHQICASLSGETVDLHETLGRLADAWEAVIHLESWDRPPDPCRWSLWQIMGRRWLPVAEGGNREWREERARKSP